MDNHLLVSASSKKAIDKPQTSKPGVVDGDAFAQLLEKELDDKNSSKSDAKDLVAGKETTRGTSSKEAHEKDDQFRQHMGLKMEKMVGTRNFIYNLALKDPNSLSLGERQSLHLGEFSQAHLEIKDFQNALADKGLHLKDLSFTQISTLSRSRSKEELNQRLEQLDLTVGVHGEAEGTPFNAAIGGRPLGTGNAIVDTTRGIADTGTRAVSETAATDAADRRKLQREDVIRQIMAHIDVQRVANQTELALKLNPEFLGDLKIKLNFEGRGNIAADFETTSKETKDLIDEGLDSLKESFGRQGMTLTSGRTHLVEQVT